MKMHGWHRVWRTAAAALAACVLLSGCTPGGMDARALMHPPRPTGDKAAIYALLEEKAGRNFLLKYPEKGNYRSAIIQQDFGSGAQQEALAFYQRSDDDSSVNVLFTAKIGGKWQNVGSFSDTGTQVDRVYFGDLNGDGKNEVVVGWGSSAGSSSLLSVFVWKNGKMQEIKLDQTYNEMALMDMDGDGRKDLLLASIPADSQQPFTAGLFTMKDSALRLMGSMRLDTGVSKFSGIAAGKVSQSQAGVLLDAALTNGKTLTELLYWDKNKKSLAAPLYNPQSPRQNVTQRDLAVSCCDINHDGVLEFPIVTRLPGYTGDASDDVGSEIQWTRIAATSGNYRTVSSMILNTRDGYRLLLPAQWQDSITTKQDVNARTLTFYSFNSQQGTVGAPLMTAQVFSAAEWAVHKKAGTYTEVLSGGGTVVAVACPSPNDALALTPAQLKVCFQSLDSGTAG